MRRKARYRRTKRKSVKSNYIIVALLCLIILNVGAMSINIFKNRDNKAVAANPEETISVASILNKVWNNLKDSIPTFKPAEEEIEPPVIDEELGEFEESKDYFIIESLDEYESLIIIKDSDGISTVENIPSPLDIEKMVVDRNKPYIAIYHTHASEGYQPLKEGVYNIEDKTKNVIGVGEIIATVLEADNHKVNHIETYHDRPSYNKSYSRSLNTINNIKEEEKNIKVFIDVHRDGREKSSPDYKEFIRKSKIKINGVDTATFALVVGPETPNFDSVLNFAKYIKAVSDTLYPGLCKGIIIKPYGKFNLYSSNYATLLEVGGNFNTVEEAKESGKLIGEILSIVFNSLQE